MHYRAKVGHRRGMIAVFLVLSLVVLLGVVALAADGGAVLAERRHAQATADAAALAAATDLFENWPKYQGTPQEGTDPDGTASAAAVKVAGDNGYTNVTINISPNKYQGGPNAGKALPPGYAEIIVQTTLTRTFSNVFGSGDLPVQARSVAAGGWVYAPPVWVGDLSSNLAFWQGNGGGNVTIGQTPTAVNPYGGRVIVNSSSTTGAVNAGGPISAFEFYFAGTALGTFNGNVHNNQYPAPDPLGFLPPPTQSATKYAAINSQFTDQTLNPGTYIGGILVGSNLGGSANLTLNPGIYYMQGGGFQFYGQGTLKVNGPGGVMIYNAPTDDTQGVFIQGTGSWTLSPPTSGPYTGLTIFQDRNSAAPVVLQHDIGHYQNVATNVINYRSHLRD